MKFSFTTKQDKTDKVKSWVLKNIATKKPLALWQNSDALINQPGTINSNRRRK